MYCEECGQKILLVKIRNGKKQQVNLNGYTIITDKGDILSGYQKHKCKINKVIDLVEMAKNRKND